MKNIRQEQLNFLDWEFGVFFHFGLRTFYEGHRDWDGKTMELSAFDPQNLSCEEWIGAVEEAGAKYAVLVCKHHDGFANWPSAYTDYGVKNTPWKDGKGDVVRDFVDACRRHSIKVGLYYSPAQVGWEQQSAKDYDDYFINQVTELLTQYGTIDYLWFDGCGSEGHCYDTKRIVKAIRSCQPNILLFNMWDPDTRWVGNESGLADSPNPLWVDAVDISVKTEQKDTLLSRRFLPAECDCRMRLDNWFYSDLDSQTVKSVDELMGLYYYSVGRGANLLVNIGPDRTGRLPQADRDNLLELGRRIRMLEESTVPCQVAVEADKLTVTMDMGLVNHVTLEEVPGEDMVASFEIRAYPVPYGAPITLYRGTTIGHKAICPFPTVRTEKLEILLDRPAKVKAQLQYMPRF